jgi:hypothetical protein
MGAFIFTSEPGWRKRAWRLVLTLYFAAGVAACVAGALSPRGQFGLKKELIVGASIAFGAALGLLRLPRLLARYAAKNAVHLRSDKMSGVSNARSPRITRTLGWIFAAGLALAIFLTIIAPGLRFNQ